MKSLPAAFGEHDRDLRSSGLRFSAPEASEIAAGSEFEREQIVWRLTAAEPALERFEDTRRARRPSCSQALSFRRGLAVGDVRELRTLEQHRVSFVADDS